ncbi:putative nuclease HARBI1, partial [Pseudolycoriella hygida]
PAGVCEKCNGGTCSVCRFSASLSKFGLKSIGKDPTNFDRRPSLIDFVLSNRPAIFAAFNQVAGGVSNHDIVFASVLTPDIVLTRQITLWRDFNAVDVGVLLKGAKDGNINEIYNCSDVNSMFEIFNGVLVGLLDEHVPLKQFKNKASINSTKLWYSSEIDKAVVDRELAKRNWKRDKSNLLFDKMLSVAALEYHNNKVFMKVNRRQLRDSFDSFDIPDERFREIYRLPRRLALDFLDELGSVMVENKAPDIPLTTCCALNFFASGSYQRRVGQDAFASMSQTCVSRCVSSISRTIATKLMDRYIKFPQSIEKIEKLSQDFQKMYDFPGVFGIVDGSHIILSGLKRAVEFAFKNRNKSHSINAQFICDSKMRFLNVNARYPGSNHDAIIWRCSLAFSFLENIANEIGEEWQHFLLGDTGYPLQPWLLKPYDTPTTAAQKQFNANLRRLRSLVERAIGLLKARFRCLLNKRKLRYSPLTSGHIIYSCSVLHNFLIENGYRIDEMEPIYDEQIEFDYPYFNDYKSQGEEMRSRMTQYFADI